MMLHHYLDDIRRRLWMRFAARVSLGLVVGAALVTGLFAVAFVALVPDAGVVDAVRVALYLAIAATVFMILRRRYSARVAAAVAEARIPAFDGRLETWRDTTARAELTPLGVLLERDVTAAASNHATRRIVRPQEIALPATSALVLAIAMVAVMLAGDSPWQLSALRLWAGDAFSDAAPRIVVTPGDVVIPRGSDVVIEASTRGFDPQRLTMNAVFQKSRDWEQAPMSGTGAGAFAFVFVGVMEDVEYYVGSGIGPDRGVNSDRFVIRVADLPRIASVEVTWQLPAWTGLPVAKQAGGDLRVLPETTVEVHAESDLPLEDAVLVVNGVPMPGVVDGSVLTGSFAVHEAGSWHVAVRYKGILTRISDSWRVELAPDRPPEIAFEWPGRDRRASAIEEVGLRFRARDDYGIDAVALRYAVNGGEWMTLPATVGSSSDGKPTTDQALDQVLYLEELQTTDAGSEAPRALQPGDIVSFYGEVKDHSTEVRSSLYFVDVRPFDRLYRETQESGGEGGGGGRGFESSQRQREIVTATWNLINRRKGGAVTQRDTDQAAVLGGLQRTLKEQVETLIERAGARRLGEEDDIGAFLTELTHAVEDMEPAAVELERVALEAAITPAQKALQHLLAAEATMHEVDVSQSRGDGSGGASQSLDELVELELDPERNRYEVPQSPKAGGQADEEDEWRQLEELAARQEQLADSRRDARPSLPSRWQQEQLRRDVEALRQQMQVLQQSASAQPSPSSAGAAQPSSGAASADEALAQMDEALQAIDESLQQPGSDAGRRASQALSRSARNLRQAEIGNLDQRLARLGEQVGGLLESQRGAVDRLEELGRQIRDVQENGGRVLVYDYILPLAEQKQRMQEAVAEVTSDIARAAEAVGPQSPDASRVLTRAIDQLAEDQVEARLAYTADLISMGRPLLASTQEEIVQNSLERLNADLALARGYLGDALGTDDPLSAVRAMRRDLSRARQAGTGGDASALDTVVWQVDQLQARLTEALGETITVDTTLDRKLYVARGIADENGEALFRLTSDRLDLMENALLRAAREPVHAQTPRDQARDSAAADRYFRALGRKTGVDP